MTETERAPRLQIRRFDIFAEWNRLKARTRHKLKEADAQAYGLAVAKVVAARKLHGAAPEQTRDLKRRARQDEVDEPWWEHLGSSDSFIVTIRLQLLQVLKDMERGETPPGLDPATHHLRAAGFIGPSHLPFEEAIAPYVAATRVALV